MHSGHRLQGRFADRRIVQHSHLTGESPQAQAVAPVRRKIQIDDAIIQLQRHPQVFPGRQLFGQFQNAIMVLAQREFGRAAEHALGLHPAQLCLPDPDILRQHRAHPGERRHQPRAHVGSTTDHLVDPLAIIHLTDGKLVSIRMRSHLPDQAHHHTAEFRGYRRHPVHLQSGHGQLFQKRIRRQIRIHPLAEPLLAVFHSEAPVRLVELAEESKVVLEEQSQVIDPV